ncbi:hypothetical protein HHI36_023548 [Cryptolaemus montrouzieri]|uniref:Uncharacterized protein n=1 Tax=Cryptolaemus montrouzieri TaxID=559131 RepID=A0ABD2PGR2_9CUCU
MSYAEMKNILSVLLWLLVFVFCEQQNDLISNGKTVITTKNITALSPKIDLKVLKKPHHLIIGRCYPHYQIIHQEHIIVKNDGKSHVDANIRINVDGPVNITCVLVYDEMDQDSAYPLYSGGGVGQNFVGFNVKTTYGKGFHFFVQIFGIKINETLPK